jgi:hypothetical protein
VLTEIAVEVELEGIALPLITDEVEMPLPIQEVQEAAGTIPI